MLFIGFKFMDGFLYISLLRILLTVNVCAQFLVVKIYCKCRTKKREKRKKMYAGNRKRRRRKKPVDIRSNTRMKIK